MIEPMGLESLAIPTSKKTWSMLRAEMRAKHHCVIPGAITGRTLKTLWPRIKLASFEYVRNPRVGNDWLCRDDRLQCALNFLVYDPLTIEFVRFLADQPSIRGFQGRLSRFDSQNTSGYDWHDDFFSGNRVGVSFNLSPVPFRGGDFEIRGLPDKKILGRLRNTAPGSALLFHIDRKLQHRVHPVLGTEPKISFTGWFCSAPSAP